MFSNFMRWCERSSLEWIENSSFFLNNKIVEKKRGKRRKTCNKKNNQIWKYYRRDNATKKLLPRIISYFSIILFMLTNDLKRSIYYTIFDMLILTKIYLHINLHIILTTLLNFMRWTYKFSFHFNYKYLNRETVVINYIYWFQPIYQIKH